MKGALRKNRNIFINIFQFLEPFLLGGIELCEFGLQLFRARSNRVERGLFLEVRDVEGVFHTIAELFVVYHVVGVAVKVSDFLDFFFC